MVLHTVSLVGTGSLATQSKLDILLLIFKNELIDTGFLLKQLYWSKGHKMLPLKSL